MPKHKPIPFGARFGRLVVQEMLPERSRHGLIMYRCTCDCGASVDAIASRLQLETLKSCGCYQRDRAAVALRKTSTTHGETHHPLYAVWTGMRQRCLNPNATGYRNYGGRGITIDPRWDDFMVFVADMGERPSADHTLDRMDNNGPYSPTNCHWATWSQQQNNRRPQASRVGLSDDQIREIRRRRATGERIDMLAAAFGVGRYTVYDICSGRSFKRLLPPAS